VEHAYVQLCLGLDYRRGGFVDRALEAFHDVLRLDPQNQDALLNLEKLHADQRQWHEAYRIRQRLAAVADESEQAQHFAILAFLENELGRDALKRADYGEAARRFEAAIERDRRVIPAYVNIGDVRFHEGDAEGARAAWERLIEFAPDRAYLVFDRLSALCAQLGQEERFTALCRRLITESPQDWRSRLALARQVAGRGSALEAFELVVEALHINPHPIMLHQAAWQILGRLRLDPTLVDRYVAASREAVFFQDPHVCLRCHYRSNELLWLCPHCHEWNTFVEERLSPSRGAPRATGRRARHARAARRRPAGPARRSRRRYPRYE
jgi:lipopolysaccharide biosynthesis regulator YciM